MDDNTKQELERLIEVGKSFDGKFKEVGDFYTYYTLPNVSLYKEWQEECLLWTKHYYASEIKNIESLLNNINKDGIAPYYHDSLMAKLKAMLKYPEKKNESMKVNKVNRPSATNNIINIHSTQNQTQTQEQSQTQKIVLKIFLEAIKDELTGKQQKEIKAILEDHKDNIEEAKPKLQEKLSSFGINTLAGIVGNILTNPTLVSTFASSLY